jgi:hypothetical protein
MSNQIETLEMILQAASYLDEEYVVGKILTILGDADKVQDVLDRRALESADRYKQETNKQDENENPKGSNGTEE